MMSVLEDTPVSGGLMPRLGRWLEYHDVIPKLRWWNGTSRIKNGDYFGMKGLIKEIYAKEKEILRL